MSTTKSRPPDHSALLSEQVLDIIRRAHWQSARSVAHVPGGKHAYVVMGWNKDDVTEGEFFLAVSAIRTYGRREVWTPPVGFYDSGNRRPMTNTYLYLGEFAYWYTKPSEGPHMLNRESVAVQLATPTRRVLAPELEQLALSDVEAT
jgi:hypothetical protein